MTMNLLYKSIFVCLFLVSLCGYGATPTVQATNLNITGIGSTYLTVSWTRGNGQAVLIVCKPSFSTTSYPANGYIGGYNASITYGNGSNLGNSNYVVYDGTGTSTTIYGLANNTGYTVYAYEYNTTYNSIADDFYYYHKTTLGSNYEAGTTLCSEPTTGPGTPTFSSVAYTTATISWTAGIGGSYELVTVDESPYAQTYPVDGTTYTASTSWGSGSATGTDNYVVYNSSSTSVNVSNLKSATSYRARIYTYNCTGGQQNYYTGGYSYADFTTDNYPPTINAISSYTICQNSSQQIVSLSGLSDGSSAETQTVTISATSSNQTLIPNANISTIYSSPNTFGYVTYTPASGQSGTAVITVVVNDNFTATNTTTATFTVTVLAIPSSAVSISGTSTVCAGGGTNYTYSVTPITNATGYTWTIPTGWSIVGGSGTNSITLTPLATASSGNISVYGTNGNGCGNGATVSKSVTVDAQPATAYAGTDQNPTCTSTAFLNATAVSTPNSGAWTLLPGPPAPTIGNANSNSTSVTGLANNQTYNYVWTVTNGGVCPVKKDTVKIVTDFSNPACTPSANYSYSGSTASGIAGSVCLNTAVQFTDLSVSANSWDWDFDYTGVFGSMSSLQNPSYTFTATGTYTVRLKIHSNATGLDYTNDQVINVISAPATPGSISGILSGMCAGDANQVNYSIAAVTNATAYNWTYPTGVNHSANSADWTLVSVLFSTSAVDGNVSVTASNGCGTSAASSIAVNVNEFPGNASGLSGNATVCQGANSETYSVPSVAYATAYAWTLPGGATGTSTTSSISVDFSTGASSGNIVVVPSNSCGTGAADTIAITVNPLPASSGPVTGSANLNICPVPNSVMYSVSSIANATGYTWSVSNGGIVTGGNGMDSILVDFSAAMTPGNISVYGTNACGNGTASSALAVSFNPVTMTDMCIATVDSASNFNEIFWIKPADDAIDSFRIYRRVSAVANVLVGTVAYEDPAYIKDLTSGADPNSNFEEYTITSVDTCGNESDSAMYHRTMFLAPPVYGTNSVTLNWNLYVGQAVNYYRILRDTTGAGNAWDVVDTSVNPGVTTWVDNNLPTGANTNILYRVEVDWVTTCDPSRAVINTSRSNIKSQAVNVGVGIAAEDISDLFAVYPNPAKDVLNVDLKKGMKGLVIEVYDVLGQLVYSAKPSSSENRLVINTSALSSGVYFIRFNSDNGKGVKKLVIEE
jgi:hypothetical protein